MQEERIWLLLGKKHNGEISARELAELEELLRRDESRNFSAGVIEELWGTPLTQRLREGQYRECWERIKGSLAVMPQAPARRRSMRWVAVAATALALLGSALFLWRERAAPAPAQKSTNQVSTQLGSRTKIELPDGTRVWLNAGSKLTYENFDKTASREVSLSGEAYFEVVHDEDNPFIIHTEHIDIRDIGTSFEVRAYPEEKEVEATLITGAIEIFHRDHPEEKVRLKPHERIVIPLLEPGEGSPLQHHEKSATPYTILPAVPTKEGLLPQTAWVDNKLVFDNEPFASLALRMEKWYNVSIHFRSSKLRELRFSGIIEKESLEQAFQAMQFSRPFRYTLKNNEVWIDDH